MNKEGILNLLDVISVNVRMNIYSQEKLNLLRIVLMEFGKDNIPSDIELLFRGFALTYILNPDKSDG